MCGLNYGFSFYEVGSLCSVIMTEAYWPNLLKIGKKSEYGKVKLPNPDQAGIYLLKVNNINTRLRCDICSKLTIKTPGRRQWHRSGVFIVNFEHISHLALMFLLLT